MHFCNFCTVMCLFLSMICGLLAALHPLFTALVSESALLWLIGLCCGSPHICHSALYLGFAREPSPSFCAFNLAATCCARPNVSMVFLPFRGSHASTFFLHWPRLALFSQAIVWRPRFLGSCSRVFSPMTGRLALPPSPELSFVGICEHTIQFEEHSRQVWTGVRKPSLKNPLEELAFQFRVCRLLRWQMFIALPVPMALRLVWYCIYAWFQNTRAPPYVRGFTSLVFPIARAAAPAVFIGTPLSLSLSHPLICLSWLFSDCSLLTVVRHLHWVPVSLVSHI